MRYLPCIEQNCRPLPTSCTHIRSYIVTCITDNYGLFFSLDFLCALCSWLVLVWELQIPQYTCYKDRRQLLLTQVHVWALLLSPLYQLKQTHSPGAALHLCLCIFFKEHFHKLWLFCLHTTAIFWMRKCVMYFRWDQNSQAFMLFLYQ